MARAAAVEDRRLRVLLLGVRTIVAGDGPDPTLRQLAVLLRVHLDGGELTVEVGADLRVHLTGWAVPVYRGELSEELLAELREA